MPKSSGEAHLEGSLLSCSSRGTAVQWHTGWRHQPPSLGTEPANTTPNIACSWSSNILIA